MAYILPRRLLSYTDGKFKVLDLQDPTADRVDCFDIITYTWGRETQEFNCGIEGVNWNVEIPKKRLEDIKTLMIKENVQYLWVDCMCINQQDDDEMAVEILKMYEYYKSARKCYILMKMDEMWKPQDIVDNLKFIDHILSHMGGAALASEANLTEKVTKSLSAWANTKWTFPLEESIARSAAIDMGVLNCYSTCISRVRSLFNNLYFSRVWTFQEMLLGKNIIMYGTNGVSIACIGKLDTWMDLATDSKDKAYKLRRWIRTSRILETAPVNAILTIIGEDCVSLDSLQTQVKGISSTRTDIINGGRHWWRENHKGISNIFSAISIRPRESTKNGDIFRGLLGVFSGLFTPEEIKREMMGDDDDDIERISFTFFKQLSIETGYAWTKLAISSRERGEWDWIPVVANHSKSLTTDCFAAVVKLGRLKQRGLAKATAMTGMAQAPRKYMKILLKQENNGFQFVFKGCNCGKKAKKNFYSRKLIPTYDQPRNVAGDETGRILVQCATILGSIMDPEHEIVDYRRKLLEKLSPEWNISDPNAKPAEWISRCVSGTAWENPDPLFFRVHNRSMNYRMEAITGCGSRLNNKSTEGISCEVRVNCGCTIIAPFSLIFEAITAVKGSFLGERASVTLDEDRIVLTDGLGLVQVGDVGRAFNLVAFGGDANSHKAYSRMCRTKKAHNRVDPKLPWPKGRALVREEFTHGITDSMRKYGYVETGGSGNLLICRRHPMGKYRNIGVCIDEVIENKRGSHTVIIR